MNALALIAEVSGTVCKVAAAAGQAVNEGDVVLIVESMKLEIPVAATESGTVVEVLVTQGEAVEEGQTVAMLRPQSPQCDPA